ncbi:MAG: carbohydrate ABC transporter permease [Thermomicrobiales bacterium]
MLSPTAAKLDVSHVASGRTRKSIVKRLWTDRWSYIFMLPSLVLIAMFSFYPIVASWYYSLLDWSGVSSERTFIGLDNYREIIKDPFFWDAFRRSFLFVVATVPLEVGLSLVVAVILNDRALRFAPVFRTLFFIPVVTTTAIMSIVMSFVVGAFNGPVNQALITLRILNTPVDWLGNPDTALWTMAIIGVWKWFGQPMIYWLAALQTIPQDVYEAAKVDGASAPRIFRTITVPLLIPFALIILLIITVGNLNVFALIQAATNGGPFFATETMELFIYRNAFGANTGSFTEPRLGYASAAGIIFGVCIMAISLLLIMARRYGSWRELRGGERKR